VNSHATSDITSAPTAVIRIQDEDSDKGFRIRDSG
jgi:hypothetical protein